jgi:Ca2+-binding EF-hand superfamily protein
VEFVSYQPEPPNDDALAELQSRLNDTLARNEANIAGSSRNSATKSGGGESKYDQSRDSDDLEPSSSSDAAPVPPRVVLTAFHRRDPDRAGWVTASVFRRVLSDDLGLECSGPELRDLEDRFDLGLDSMAASSKGNNNSSLSRVEDQVRYDLFAKWVCAGHKVSAVERRVKRSLQCLVAHPDNKRKTTFLARAFEAAMDSRDRDGTVNLHEFVGVVRKLGLLATEGEVRALGKAYALPAVNRRGRETEQQSSLQDVVVDWQRFTALAQEGSARSRHGEEEVEDADDEDAPEGELAAADDDVTALAFQVRSRVRAWSKKHPGELAAYVVSLLHSSSSGGGGGASELAKTKSRTSSSRSGGISGNEEGMLSVKQLRTMLKACGNVRLASADDDAALAACFDPNGQSGDASIDLLVDFLFPPPLLAELDVSLGSGIRRRLRSKAQTPADLKLLFGAADRKAHGGPDKKGTGYLPRQTFKKCLLKADEGLAPDEIAALESAFGDDNDDDDGGSGRGRQGRGSDSESESFNSDRSDDSSGDERDGKRRSKKTTRGRQRSGSTGGGGWGMWGRSSDKQEGEVCWLRVVAWLEAANATKVVSRCRLGLAARLSRGGSASNIFDKASSRHGRLERVELEALVSSQGVVLSEAQSDALWQHLDRDEVGYLDEKAFAQLCGDLSKGSSSATMGRDQDYDRTTRPDMVAYCFMMII